MSPKDEEPDVADTLIDKKKEDKALRDEVSVDGDDDIPSAEAESIKKFLSLSSSFIHQGSVPSPIANKVNEEHISKALEYAEKSDSRSHHLAIIKIIRDLLVVLIFVGVFLFLIIYLYEKEGLLGEILRLLFAFLGGFGGGYGYKAVKQGRPEKE